MEELKKKLMALRKLQAMAHRDKDFDLHSQITDEITFLELEISSYCNKY